MKMAIPTSHVDHLDAAAMKCLRLINIASEGKPLRKGTSSSFRTTC